MEMFVELPQTKVKQAEKKSKKRGPYEKRSVLKLQEILKLVADNIVNGMQVPCDVTVEVNGELKKGIDAEGKIFGVIGIGVEGVQKDNFKIAISAHVDPKERQNN